MTIHSPYELFTASLQAAYAQAGWGELEPAAAQSSISFCEIEFGDFASNLALSQAKLLSKSPREIADTLVAALVQDELILTAEVAGPGFINVRLSKSTWADYANDLSESFYRRPSSGKKVNVEFISANPTGPLVLVNAWGGYYGDVLANIYDSQGWSVTREYYLNNGGNQIAQLGRAVQQAAGKVFTQEESAELYRGPYIDTLAAEMIADQGSFEAVCTAEPQVIGDVAQGRIFETLIKPTLERLQIQFDVVTPETTLDNLRTLDRLQKAGAIIEEDGQRGCLARRLVSSRMKYSYGHTTTKKPTFSRTLPIKRASWKSVALIARSRSSVRITMVKRSGFWLHWLRSA